MNLNKEEKSFLEKIIKQASKSLALTMVKLKIDNFIDCDFYYLGHHYKLKFEKKEPITKPFSMFSNLYGQYVQMNDRFETVHIWSEELALSNKGKWTPIAISKETYLKEIEHAWNK